MIANYEFGLKDHEIVDFGAIDNHEGDVPWGDIKSELKENFGEEIGGEKVPEEAKENDFGGEDVEAEIASLEKEEGAYEIDDVP